MEQRLLVGLGNFGNRFELTRHNLGVMVLRAWVEEMKLRAVVVDWREDKRWPTEVAQVRLPMVKIWCLFPLTMMNDSGTAVKHFLDHHGSIETKDILILHDDLELALGETEHVLQGSARGHNGVRSVHATLGGDNVSRLRLGIGRPVDGQTVDKYVLGRFRDEEQERLGDQIKKTVEQLTQLVGL